MTDLITGLTEILENPRYDGELIECAKEEILQLRDVVSNLANTSVRHNAELQIMAIKLHATTNQVLRLVQLLELVGVQPWAIKAMLEEPTTDAPT